MSGNGPGAYVRFDLGSGANFRGPAGAWASANYVGVTGANSLVSTNGVSLLMTGVKLEIGSVATPFNRQSLAKSMADCQRYYFQDLTAIGIGFNSWAANGYTYIPFVSPTTMRASPTIGLGAGSSLVNMSGVSAVQISPIRFMMNATATAAGAAGISVAGFTADAEL